MLRIRLFVDIRISGPNLSDVLVRNDRDLDLDLLSDEETKVLKKYRVWGKKKFMGREYMGINRSTFLIDPKGKIIKIWENVNVKEHALEVLKTLKSISK